MYHLLPALHPKPITSPNLASFVNLTIIFLKTQAEHLGVIMIPPSCIQLFKLVFGNLSSLCVWNLKYYNILVTSLWSVTILHSSARTIFLNSSDHISLSSSSTINDSSFELNSNSLAYWIKVLYWLWNQKTWFHISTPSLTKCATLSRWSNLLSLGFLMGK